MTDKALVVFDGVVKRFGSFNAVERMGLEIHKGEFLAIMGSSGCGKTTTLRMLAGLEAPTEGEIRLAGKRINDLPTWRRDTPMVWQSLALFPFLTVRENVEFSLRMRGVEKAERRKRVDKWLERMQITEFADRNVAHLSGGQRQRVALARSLVTEPEILLLDEPLSALDRQLRARLQDELKSLHRQVGVTVVNVTHDQDEALSMSTHIAVINHGRIVQYGTPDDIYENPATRFVARFIGRSNVVAVERIESRGDGLSALVAGQWLPVAGNQAVTGKVALSLRPEMIEINPPGTEKTDAQKVVMDARIENCVYHGGTTALDIRTAIGPLRAEMPTSRRGVKPTAGATVQASWPVRAGRIVSEDDTALDQQ